MPCYLRVLDINTYIRYIDKKLYQLMQFVQFLQIQELLIWKDVEHEVICILNISVGYGCINAECTELTFGNRKLYLCFMIISTRHEVVNVDKVLPRGGQVHRWILDSQYHRCWCPGDQRSQEISSNGIEYFAHNFLVSMRYYRTRWIHFAACLCC